MSHADATYVSLTGSKSILEEVSIYAVDTGKTSRPTPLEVAKQVICTSDNGMLDVVLL